MTPALQIVDLVVTDASKSFAPVADVASAMVEILHGKGRCTPKDLFAKGFTPDAVTQHWHLAHSIASLEVRLMGSPESNLKELLRRWL